MTLVQTVYIWIHKQFKRIFILRKIRYKNCRFLLKNTYKRKQWKLQCRNGRIQRKESEKLYEEFKVEIRFLSKAITTSKHPQQSNFNLHFKTALNSYQLPQITLSYTWSENRWNQIFLKLVLNQNSNTTLLHLNKKVKKLPFMEALLILTDDHETNVDCIQEQEKTTKPTRIWY